MTERGRKVRDEIKKIYSTIYPTNPSSSLPHRILLNRQTTRTSRIKQTKSKPNPIQISKIKNVSLVCFFFLILDRLPYLHIVRRTKRNWNLNIAIGYSPSLTIAPRALILSALRKNRSYLCQYTCNLDA